MVRNWFFDYEQLPAFRILLGLCRVLLIDIPSSRRPADGNETSAAYYIAMTSRETPSMMVLSRQNLPQLENSTIEKAIRGGYIVAEVGDGPARITLISTGSEVCICIDAALILHEKHGVPARLVSLPCWEVFDRQDQAYRLSVLPDGIPCLSVEALSTYGWERYSHEQFGLNRFGASGSYKDVYKVCLIEILCELCADARVEIRIHLGRNRETGVGDCRLL
jgi:transketolase